MFEKGCAGQEGLVLVLVLGLAVKGKSVVGGLRGSGFVGRGERSVLLG